MDQLGRGSSFRQLVVAAAAAGEVAGAVKPSLVLNLGAASVVDGLAVATLA